MSSTRLHEEVQVRAQDFAIAYQLFELPAEEHVRWRELGIPRFVFFEWTEYFFDTRGVVRISCRHEQAERIADNLFRYTFKNQIGHGRICAEFNDGRVVTTDIEVLSRKFPNLDSHFSFYISLVDDLFAQHISLPFDIESSTYHGVDESYEPPTLLFVYHFFASRAQTLAQAIQIILSSPHRLLTVERDRIPIYHANHVDVDSIRTIVSHPEELQATNANFLIAEKLRGYAPLYVLQDTPTETLNTPENRFVKHFLDTLFVWLERLGENPLFRERKSTTLNYVHSALEMARQNPLFDDVSEMTMFPTTSTVLLKRDGYRELLQLYREFNLSRMPIWRALQDAIDARDVAKLYEYWCLFELTRKLEQVCGKRAFRFNFGTAGEISEGKIVAEFADGSHLVYNRQFAQDEKASYSVAVRPDFVFEDKQYMRLIFDAKFRFDEHESEQDTEGRTAKEADILKMNGYKDALHARAAFVIFPNDNPINDRYDSETREPAPASFAELVKGDWRGVGAIGMMPTQRSEQ